MTVLGADKKNISRGADSSCVSLGVALSVLKNAEGGTKYQVGWKTSPTSRMESCKLVLSETYLGLMEHKPRQVGPCLTHSLWVRLLYSVPSGEKLGTSQSTLLRTRIACKYAALKQLVEANFTVIKQLLISSKFFTGQQVIKRKSPNLYIRLTV